MQGSRWARARLTLLRHEPSRCHLHPWPCPPPSHRCAAELIAYINAHEDVARTQLPAKADEKLAAHITPLWTAVEAAGTEPAAVQADLAEMLETVDRQPTCVSRYFDGPTLRKEESELVMAVLFEGKITKMADIADKELAQDIFGEQALLDDFVDAAKDFSNARISPEVRNYVSSLAAAGAVHMLRPSYDFFATVADARSTMADVTVQSAIALTDAQQEKIRGAVARYLPAGKDDSDVDFVVDGSIAGGLIVTVDDVVIDLSAASFLNSAAASVSISEERA